jgi:hypothetical protein
MNGYKKSSAAGSVLSIPHLKYPERGVSSAAQVGKNHDLEGE